MHLYIYIYIYIYILYIYICCRIKNLSKNCFFWVNKLSKFSNFSYLFFVSKKTNNCDLLSQESVHLCCATYTWTDSWLNLGQIFESTFFTFWGLFSFLKICWNPYYIGFQQKWHFVAHPKKLRTLFVNTIALTDFCHFSALLFFVFVVSGFWSFFLKGMKKTKN